jgi:hypothetical protein
MPGKAKSRRRRRRKQPKKGSKSSHGNGSSPNKRSSSIGHSIGSVLGGAIGNWAQKGISSLIGRGDYAEEHAQSGLDVEANSIVQPMTASQVPIFSTPEHLHGAVRVQHREYIMDLKTAETAIGNLMPLRISPTNSNMFPWLVSTAQSFEQWLPLGIVFEFVSTAGNAFSGGAANLGDVNMATLYDVAAPPLNTKSEILNHFYSTSAATSQNLMHAIECAPDDTPCLPRYINSGASFPTDPRLNDLGILYILTTGSQSTYTAGQLWVTYDIILLKPRLRAGVLVDSYYTALEITIIDEAAKKAGSPLTREQYAALVARIGPRPNSEDDEIQAALDKLNIKVPQSLPAPEEKSPEKSTWNLLS